MRSWLTLLLLIGAARADSRPTLNDALAPLHDQRASSAIDEATYRAALEKAIDQRASRPTWQAGLALGDDGQRSTGAGRIAVRVDQKPLETFASWREVRARFSKLRAPAPDHCAFGCCTYPARSDKDSAGTHVVTRACFDAKRRITDLDLDSGAARDGALNHAIEKAAADPLGHIGSVGAWLWGDVDSGRVRVPSGAAIQRRYVRKASATNLGSVLIAPEIEACHNACCTYATPHLPCNVGGAHPEAHWVASACFDRDGKTVELRVVADRYDDPEVDPDAP